jgi:hypothetical protein
MDEPTQEPNNTLLIKVGQASIEVRAGFDPELFLKVVRTLKS